MARSNIVTRANKSPGVCGRCKAEILKGESYYWAKPGFRAHGRALRCHRHPFRPSELTTSKMAAVYAAQEDAEGRLADWTGESGTTEDLQSILEDTAQAVRDVAQEYTDAAEAMNSAGEELQSKADELESWADEIENVTLEDFDVEGIAAEDLEDARESWAGDQREAIQDVVGNCPV